MREEVKTVIIGGGVTGLCATYYAAENFGRESVLLLEASDYVGGQTRTERADGFHCDWGPNGFLDKEPLTLDWVESMGISDSKVKCNEAAARRFIMKDDRLLEVSGPPKFFLSPLLSVRGRLRVCCEPLIKAKRNGEPESVWSFGARRIGREAADMMVSPMVSGIFGGDAKSLSLEHCFPRMAQMEAEYGGLFKAMIAKRSKGDKVSAAGPSGTLTSFDGGIGVVAETAAKLLRDRTRNNTKALSISKRDSGGYTVKTDGDLTVDAESVILAVPAYAGAVMTSGLDSELSSTLDSIEYANMVVVCTAYRKEKVSHSLDGFGFLVPRNQGKRLLGCLWTSSLFPKHTPKDHVLIRSMFGGYTDQSAIEVNDTEILEQVAKEVHPLLGIDGQPDFVRIFRWPRGIPQYLLNHGEVLASIEAAEKRHKGLALAGNAYRGVSLNDCVVSARRAVDLIASTVSQENKTCL